MGFLFLSVGSQNAVQKVKSVQISSPSEIAVILAFSGYFHKQLSTGWQVKAFCFIPL
jgi:hypothetical protein